MNIVEELKVKPFVIEKYAFYNKFHKIYREENGRMYIPRYYNSKRF